MRAITICVALLLPGCGSVLMTEPERQAGKDLEPPDTWTSTETGHEGVVALGWLQTFEDPEMERLVAEAIEYNRDLKAAAARLRVAKEGTIFGRAARLPSVSVSGSGSHSRSRVRDEDDVLQPWGRFEDYGLSLNLSWEVDLWGRLRNLHRATVDDYEAAEADFRGARLSLAANTARAWYNLIAAGEQVELARKTRDSFSRNYRITYRNYKAGDDTASALDVQFGRNNVASAERGLISRQLARDDAKRSLEILLGRYPAASLQDRVGLPELPRDVPTGLPSELLMRRPDLAAAAAALRASAERAEAAPKNLLPSIRLSGERSNASQKLGDVIMNPLSVAWSVAASIAQPVFEGGTLTAEARQALARNEAAIASFAGTALRAFAEVESAMAREQSLAEEETFLATEEAQAALAEKSALRDYTQGIVGILAILESQRRAFNARNAMISLRNERLQTRIDLHLALGGDFESVPPAPPEEPRVNPVEQSLFMHGEPW